MSSSAAAGPGKARPETNGDVVKPLARPVTLAEIKANAVLARIPLVTQSRLSVMPIPKPAFDRIVTSGKQGR